MSIIQPGGGIFQPGGGAGNWRFLHRGGPFPSHTGTLNETLIASHVLPAHSMGPNGILRVTLFTSAITNNANVKTPRFRLGNGLLGTSFMGGTHASATCGFQQRMIFNQNSEAIQIGFAQSANTSFAITTASQTAGAIDTGVDQDMVFSLQLAVDTDAITLSAYLIEVMYLP